MNKYIYKVRFVTLNFFEQKVMHKHELIFGKQQQFQQQKKLTANKLFGKYECFMFILTKISFFNFGCRSALVIIIIIIITPHAHARAGGYVMGAGAHIYVYICIQ